MSENNPTRRSTSTPSVRKNWDKFASRIVPRRHDGTTFDQKYTGGGLDPETNDLWPGNLGTEVTPDPSRNMFDRAERRQGRDGLWRPADQQEQEPRHYGPEQYRPDTQSRDIGKGESTTVTPRPSDAEDSE